MEATLQRIRATNYLRRQISENNLHVSAYYVLWWHVPDALRELVQNMIDEINASILAENVDLHTHALLSLEPDGVDGTHIIWYTDYNGLKVRGRIRYHKELKMLVLQNPGCIPMSALLLGGGTKTTAPPSDDVAGRFGEGMKLAILVLLRAGKSVTIHTGGKRWDFILRVQEPQFSEPTLHYTITDDPGQPANLVSLEISNLSLEEWIGTPENNQGLHCFLALRKLMGEPIEEVKPIGWPRHSKELGTVLLGPHVTGKVFCKGVFVDQPLADEVRLALGYNFVELDLGRDRNVAVNQLQLNWMTSHTIGHILDNSEALRAAWPGLNARWEWFLNAVLDKLMMCHGEFYYSHCNGPFRIRKDENVPGQAISPAGANILLHRWWTRNEFRAHIDFPWHNVAQLTLQIAEMGLSDGVYSHKPTRCHPAAVFYRATDFRTPQQFVAALPRTEVQPNPEQGQIVQRVKERLNGLLGEVELVFINVPYRQSYRLQNRLFISAEILNPEAVAREDPGITKSPCETKLLIIVAKLNR